MREAERFLEIGGRIPIAAKPETIERKESHMLVLTREIDQSIMIGDDVEITVVEIRGSKIRLGIRAAKTTPVHRREIYDAIRKQKRVAKMGAPREFKSKAS